MIGSYRDIILAPVITEKAAMIAANGDKIVFKVKKDANKTQIKQAIEKIYNVKLRPYEKDIIKKYKKGISVNAISVEYGVSWLTVKNFLTKYVGEKEEEIKEHNKRNFRNSKRRKSYKEKMNK